jgi:F420H(2)-dependent quinone reductase
MEKRPKPLTRRGRNGHAPWMGFGSTLVCAFLRSPLHPLLSGSTAVVRYRGRKSGREISTPVQYVRTEDELIILVGRPENKRWWRNFRTERALDVLIRGRWLPMTGLSIEGSDQAEVVAPLLELYLRRFPKADRLLAGGTAQERSRQAVVVWCRPRSTKVDPAYPVRLPKSPSLGIGAVRRRSEPFDCRLTVTAVAPGKRAMSALDDRGRRGPVRRH